jgi:hypothetical protein
MDSSQRRDPLAANFLDPNGNLFYLLVLLVASPGARLRVCASCRPLAKLWSLHS